MLFLLNLFFFGFRFLELIRLVILVAKALSGRMGPFFWWLGVLGPLGLLGLLRVLGHLGMLGLLRVLGHLGLLGLLG